MSDGETVERVCRHDVADPIPAEEAIAQLAAAFTDNAQRFTETVQGLAAHGMSAVEVFDAVNFIAVFACANRPMLGFDFSVPKE